MIAMSTRNRLLWRNAKINFSIKLRHEKPTFWFPTLSDTNQVVQQQKMARSLKFRIWKVEGLCYLCSKNKSTDQLRSYHYTDRFAVTTKLICVFVFAYAKCCFSLDMALSSSNTLSDSVLHCIIKFECYYSPILTLD